MDLSGCLFRIGGLSIYFLFIYILFDILYCEQILIFIQCKLIVKFNLRGVIYVIKKIEKKRNSALKNVRYYNFRSIDLSNETGILFENLLD